MIMDGFLLLDKAAGLSSNQVLTQLKKRFNIKKMGHTGTLDPFATGLLVVAIGHAAKAIPYLQEEPKIYDAVLVLGSATDTLDKTGTVVALKKIPPLLAPEVTEIFKSLIGNFDLVPPMYSAKKIQGEKLYELARQGKIVERKPVKTNIYNITLQKLHLPQISFQVSVSKGAYVRVIGELIAEKMGTVGHLVALKRMQAGDFKLVHACNLADTSWTLADHLLPISRALSHLPQLQVAENQLRDLSHGRNMDSPTDLQTGALVVLCDGEVCVGVGICDGNQIHPKRMFMNV